MTGVTRPAARAEELAARLRQAADALLKVVGSVDAHHWALVPGPGVWSIGKEVAHVAEATVMHQWIVRRTIGDRVPSRRPPIERREMTTPLTPRALDKLIRQRRDEGVTLLLGLSDAQLDLPTKPPRARGQLLAETIERVLIGHYDTHRTEIERKLSGPAAPAT